MDTLAIIKRIEIRLSEIGMSKADFYRQSGISSASFSQWNTGVHNPTEKKLQAAAECLGVSLEYLLGKETKKDPVQETGCPTTASPVPGLFSFIIRIHHSGSSFRIVFHF